MNRVKIPEQADAALALLSELGSIVTSTEWRRAAIVAALVGPPPGRGYESVATSGDWSYTVDGLTTLGIVGLRSHTTVERYRNAWFANRQRAPRLGDTVDLSGLPEWPPDSKTPDTTPGAQKVKDIQNNRRAMATAIRQDKPTAEAAAEALAESAEGRLMLWQAIDKATPGKDVEHRASREVTQSRLLIAGRRATKAVDDLITEVRAHGERLTAPEAEYLAHVARRLQAASTFVEALSTGQSLDEELIALLDGE